MSTQANKQLERWETIKKFEILPSELSVDEGEVTPSLKIRRKAVEKKYDRLLDGMYDRTDPHSVTEPSKERCEPVEGPRQSLGPPAT